MNEIVVTLGLALALVSTCLCGAALGHALAEAFKRWRARRGRE